MVVLVTLDGVRPDAIRQASTPHIDQIVKDGSHTLTAQSVMPSITLPCHNSIFRSVPPSRHGVTSNVFNPAPDLPPSLFDIASRAGLVTGMFYNWPPLRDIAEPDSVHVSYCESNTHLPEGDCHITDMAIQAARRQRFDLLFLYLGHVDWSGHEYGWMSDEYLEAVRQADECLGRFVSASIDMVQPVDFIVFADHGGHDRGHGTDSPEDMTIPFLMWGYRVESGHTIRRPVTLLDIAPTAATLLGLKAAPEWQGTPVLEAINDTLEAQAHHHHQSYILEDN